MLFSKILSQTTNIAYDWDEIESFYKYCIPEKEDTEWIFRGQNCDKPPTPVLERTIDSLKLPKEDAFIYEYALLDRFKRNIDIIDPSIPRNLNPLESLALMRHYGAPTRLLDFTYSFYIALFFAIENFEGEAPVVWAIDALWLQKKARNYLGVEEEHFMPGKYPEDFKKYFIDKDKDKDSSDSERFVYQVTSDRINQRLSIQQGTFLCPSDIRLPFEENFEAIIESEGEQSIHSHIKLLIISPKARKSVLKKLDAMNISRASLFPGLEGFARSIHTVLLSDTAIKVYLKKWNAVYSREKDNSSPKSDIFR